MTVECRINVPLNCDKGLRNRAAMEANYCFWQSNGCTLALDEEDNLVLQCRYALDTLSENQFQALLEAQLSTALRLDEAFGALCSDFVPKMEDFIIRV